ncbi:MAG: TIM barrel protein [Nanobdellota archaeon]
MDFNNLYAPQDQDLNDDPFPSKNVIEAGPLPRDPSDPAGREAAIEEPIVPTSEIGASVPEGSRFGNFIQSMQQAIRKGAGRLELATGMGGGQEQVGAEAYGTEARRELRDIAKANDVNIHSIHSPSNVGNVSGYNPQERGFNDEHRKMELEEVKKAIDFAGDVTDGGSVVVHTGEYLRDMTDAPWNRKIGNDGDYQFQSYEEEPEKQVKYMVDDRTGKLISEVRKSQVQREPAFKTDWDPKEQRYRWIDINGNFIDPRKPNDLFKRVPDWDEENNQFKTKRLTWRDFEDRAKEWNKWKKKPVKDSKTGEIEYKDWTPEEVFFKTQMDTRILQAQGSALFHGQHYPEAKKSLDELKRLEKYYEELEKNLGEDEVWKIMQNDPVMRPNKAQQMFGRTERKRPTEIIKDEIKDQELNMRFIHESSGSADAQAAETYETFLHVKPIEDYAKEQTSKSYAELGIHAMEKTKEKKTNDPIFVAPENIFPEMGYGSHPDELIELVQNAREQMVEYLTEKKVPDPKGGWEEEQGNDEFGLPQRKMVNNPYYRGLSKEEAEKVAEQHIKATVDTQHLGMWWKNFQPKEGETVEERKERFDNWYMEQIKKLEDAGVIGNVHLVDGKGGGHHHLPAGQGDMPVVEAMKYLKKKGYTGNISSEGYGEDQMSQGRQLTATWDAMGNKIHSKYGPPAGFEGSAGAPQTRFSDIHNSYFGANQSPYFVFGNYSPSNDWQMWTQVPME